MFKKVNPRQNFPEMERNIMNFWEEDKIFEKSVDSRSDKKTYSFFDGPPFATGLPHYGHVVANLMKDVVPRYWTMRGCKVERRWGWDCHGLPIENLIEKEHNIKNKQEIEDMGIDKFNEACHSSVLRYADEWKKFIPRMGRWVDMENDYRTMDWKYTESIWWVFSELYKKGLVYEGHKAMHICPRCETTLSNFEVTQGYKEITDLSATVKFKLKYPVGKTGRGVGALICNGKNEVLLLRRNESGRRKTWAMPGGKIDGSETFREALEREVDEELGVKIESAEPFVAKPDIFEGRLFETVCFKVKIKGEPVIKEKDKVDKLEWFALDDLPEVDFPPSRDALEAYKQNKEKFYIKADMTKPLVNVYVLAWTTTPWTLPGNVALAVGEIIKYQIVNIKGENDFYVLAKDRVEEILKDKEFEILNEIDGKELVGLEYEPLFGYYSNRNETLLNTAGDEKNTVEVVILDKEDKILLGLRKYSKDFKGEKDRWIVPGGRSEIGENLENTIRREMKEECNIQEYKIIKYLGSGKGYQQGDIVNWFLVRVDNLEQIKNNEPEKFTEWKFFDLKDVPLDMTFDGDFDYFQKAIKEKNGWKIYSGDFVSTAEGTGIVHIAPAFGDDDMKMGQEYSLPFIQHVGMNGRFADEVVDFREKEVALQAGFTQEYGANNVGREVKPKRNPRETDEKIVKFLEENNKLLAKENFKHSYPHCWRCDTPLLNYATSSWFVKVTEIKDRMVKNNKKINWTPAYIKEGRFGKWLEDARDWAVSRSRYWGAPLPIWRCEKCENIEVINSIDDLREKTDQKITKFILLRHGESESNVKNIKAGQIDGYPLTEKGVKQSEKVAEELKAKKIDIIIFSPMLRTKQTAEIINNVLKVNCIEDERVKEYDFGFWNGYNSKELFKKGDNLYVKYRKTGYDEERYNFKLGGNGESRKEIEDRVRKFIKETVEKYKGKNVLVVGHGGINAMFHKIIDELTVENSFKFEFSLSNAEQNLFYTDNNAKAFNLHKPNIDKIKIKCSKCKSEARIVGDVFDCWFESGSMPYAQWHYSFENQDKFEKGFPAEFIAEGLDQTRGWFYTLIVLSTALFDKPAFKNVIVNGIVQAEDGQKMSKRLKNYPEPNLLIEKYGADSLRYYLLTSPVMKAENLNFSEKGVDEVLKRFVLTLWNTYSFLVMNADLEEGAILNEVKNPKGIARGDKLRDSIALLQNDSVSRKSDNLLDKWIVSELNILIDEVNKQMEDYDLVRASRPLREFIDKLSNWYVRRSRRRFSAEDTDDGNFAFQTLYYILTEYAKLIAPFMPFLADEIYKNLTDKKSVHLEDYPQANKKLIDKKVSDEMNFVRQVVTLGLAIRAKNSIKVRQPLAKLKVKSEKLKVDNDKLVELIKDELNIKSVEFVESMQIGSTQENGASSGWIIEEDAGIKVALNIEITEELKSEGMAREIVRHIQVMRKEAKYNRDDIIMVKYNFSGSGEDVKKVFKEWGDYVKKECLIESVEFNGKLVEKDFDLVKELKTGDGEIMIGIRKV